MKDRVETAVTQEPLEDRRVDDASAFELEVLVAPGQGLDVGMDDDRGAVPRSL